MLDVLKRGHTTIAEKPAPLHKIGVQLLFQQSSWLHAQAHVQRVSKHNLAAAPEQKNIPQNGDDDTQTLDAQVPAILDLEEMRQAEPWLPRPALRAGGAASSTDLSNVACACVAMLIHHRTPSASGVLSGEHATDAGHPRFAAAPPGGGGGGCGSGSHNRRYARRSICYFMFCIRTATGPHELVYGASEHVHLRRMLTRSPMSPSPWLQACGALL